MISLKKYLDMDPDKPRKGEPDSGELLSATLESYGSTLMAVAKNGVRACPAMGSDLQQALEGLHRRLAAMSLPPLCERRASR